MIYHPKTVTKYLRALNIQNYSASKKTVKGYRDVNKPNLFKQAVGDYFKDRKYPILLGLHFVRNSRRSFDMSNACHIIHDLLTAHGYIEDDNAKCLIPFPLMLNGHWYSIDKKNPGTWLKIFEEEELNFPNIKIIGE